MQPGVGGYEIKQGDQDSEQHKKAQNLRQTIINNYKHKQ